MSVYDDTGFKWILLPCSLWSVYSAGRRGTQTVDGVIYHSAVYIDNAKMTTGLAMHVTVSLVAMFAVISDVLIMLLYIVFTVNDWILFVCHSPSNQECHKLTEECLYAVVRHVEYCVTSQCWSHLLLRHVNSVLLYIQYWAGWVLSCASAVCNMPVTCNGNTHEFNSFLLLWIIFVRCPLLKWRLCTAFSTVLSWHIIWQCWLLPVAVRIMRRNHWGV